MSEVLLIILLSLPVVVIFMIFISVFCLFDDDENIT